MAGKTKKFPEVWLGRRCVVCGQKLRGRQKSYCGENCRKAAHNLYCRDYYKKNKQKETREKQQKQQPGAALRGPRQGQQQGCTAAGQPSVTDVGHSSPPPFPEKKTRAGGNTAQKNKKTPMYCEKYRQVVTGAVCVQRQERITTRGDFIDVFCRHTCRGTMLRPATAADLRQRRNLIRRVSREKGLEVMSA